MQIALRLITKDDLNYYSIRRLKEWRIKNRRAYIGNYEITQASIRKWLKKCVLENSKRMLFWVVVNGECIGHMGWNNIKKDSVEIDNVSRGVKKYPGIMHEALGILIASMSNRRIWLKVLPKNTHAIEFYEQNGFKRKQIRGDFLVMEYE